MRESLKTKILEYLKSKYPLEIHKGELGRKAVIDWGYENENMGRRCREMVKERLISPVYKKNPKTGITETWYKFIDSKLF